MPLERAPRNSDRHLRMTFELVPRTGSGEGGCEGSGGGKSSLFMVGEGLPARFCASREASRSLREFPRGRHLGTSSKVMRFSKKKLQ